MGSAAALGSPPGPRYSRLVAEEHEGQRSFPHEFDAEFVVGPEQKHRAFFGQNVLRGLIEGIDNFVASEPPVHKAHHTSDPVMLACTAWINDAELIDKLRELSGACIVATKQDWKPSNLQELREVNEQTAGLPVGAFPALGDLAFKVDGEPLVVGPTTRMGEGVLPTIRMLGFRRRKRPVPLMHAKLAVLGRLWWTDDGEFGEEVTGFEPRWLWVSSANFTSSSRSCLEFGYWTEDDALVEGAEQFLVKAIAFSEDIDAQADLLDPDLVPVEFDEVALNEALAEYSWDPDDESEIE
jgi:hypothetical protein